MFRHTPHHPAAAAESARFDLRPLLLATALAFAQAGPAQAQPSAAASQADPTGLRNYNIPAGPLSTVLVSFLSESGVLLSGSTELAQGRNSPGVQGSHTPGAALAALLAGSGLEAVGDGQGRYMLRRAASRAEGARPGTDTTLAAVTVMAATARASDLPEVYAGGQVARGGRAGFLGNADVMDTPLSAVSFTAQMVEDHQARTVGEVIASDASVRQTSQSSGVITESYAIRGFPINDGNIGDISFDGMYGVAPNYQTSAAYAERIELIKGPTALINGIAPNGALGGSINVVPKRAETKPLTRVTLDYATRSQLGTHVDFGRRFGENQEWGIRLNGVYRDGDTERDKQSSETRLGAVALDYRSNRLRASLDYVDQRLEVEAPTRQPSLQPGVAVPKAPDARRNLSQKWDDSLIRDRSLLARAEYEFSDALTGYVAAGASRSKIDGIYSNPAFTSAAGDTAIVPARLAFSLQKQSAEAGLRGRVRTGAVEHRWNLGFNTYHDEMDVGFNFASAMLLSNIHHPIDYPAIKLTRPNKMGYTRSTLRGLALADTMSFADDRVLLTLGLRRQQVLTKNPMAGTRYDKRALTPMAGLVVKPLSNLSLFANYIEGLNVGEIAPTSAVNAGEAFSPYKTKQYELGAKYDGGDWLATVSFFQITKPSGQLNASGHYRPDAQQRNRGVELSLTGEPVKGLRPLMSLSWIDGKLTRAANATVQGNDAPGVPHLQANLELEWDVPGVSGLTLTSRALHTASQYVDQANTRQLPSWWRVDLGARYAAKIASRPVVLRLQVFNVADRDYWAGVTSWGGLAMSDARTVRFSVQTDF